MMNWLALIVAAVTLLFLFIVFGLFETGNVRSMVINAENAKQEIDGVDNLIMFLKTPVDDVNNVEDLLIQSYINSDFEGLRNIAEQYFKPLYEEPKKSWRLKITEQPKDNEVDSELKGDNFKQCEGLRTLLANCKRITIIAVVKLPIKNDGVNYLELELSTALLN